jgi:hypothetical protein
MQTTIASLVSVLCLSLVATAHAGPSLKPFRPGDGSALVDPDNNDGPRGIYVFAAEVEALWRQRDYAMLDGLFDRWAQPDERFDDGRMHLTAFAPGLESALARHREPKDWEQELEKISEWRQQNPASTAVDIAEAAILESWAWSARGTGYARTVTPEGWKLFHERMNRAQEVLLRAKDRSSSNPVWFYEYMEVALQLGWEPAEFRALYDAAISRFPDFHPLYFSMIRSLLPRWGGSIEQVDAYIAEVVKQTEKRQRKIMYARLYWYVAGAEGDDFSLFEDSAATWADMKTGFQQLTAATPKSSWNLNNFASFACRAGDADTYRKLRKKIGEEIYEDAWPSNYTLEVCDERLLKAI